MFSRFDPLSIPSAVSAVRSTACLMPSTIPEIRPTMPVTVRAFLIPWKVSSITPPKPTPIAWASVTSDSKSLASRSSEGVSGISKLSAARWASDNSLSKSLLSRVSFASSEKSSIYSPPSPFIRSFTISCLDRLSILFLLFQISLGIGISAE